MKIPWWVWALGVGGVGYLLYKSFSKVPQAAAAAVNAVSTGIAEIWLNLPFVGLPPNMTLLGQIQLPDGSEVALSSLPAGKIRQGSDGSVLANVNGNIYQLSPSNAAGNYPATLLGPAPAGG
jgi:hypothetical protein